MSNLTVKGNASGTGTVILEAPNTDSNRTITLPDATATLASTAYVDSALSGAASVTLLGTIATTSGYSVTLSGLDLTEYKMLFVVFQDVSFAATSQVWLDAAITGSPISPSAVAADAIVGSGSISLVSGVVNFNSRASAPGATSNTSTAYAGVCSLRTSSTSITFASPQLFDAGSILVYGVK